MLDYSKSAPLLVLSLIVSTLFRGGNLYKPENASDLLRNNIDNLQQQLSAHKKRNLNYQNLNDTEKLKHQDKWHQIMISIYKIAKHIPEIKKLMDDDQLKQINEAMHQKKLKTTATAKEYTDNRNCVAQFLYVYKTQQ